MPSPKSWHPSIKSGAESSDYSIKMDPLRKIVSAQKVGHAVGITSICSANDFVVEAAVEHALERNRSVCIGSTAQQVNQYGGYSGMRPE